VPLGARIVLCLHDELLVHAPHEQAEAVSRLVDECLREAAQRWAPGCGVRFISDTTIVRSWSDAKNAALEPAGPASPAGAAGPAA
jgi:DNA polymerase-1